MPAPCCSGPPIWQVAVARSLLALAGAMAGSDFCMSGEVEVAAGSQRAHLWFFCIDDDGWVSAFPTARKLCDYLEPEHMDEIRILMDSAGGSYQLENDELKFVRTMSHQEVLAYASATRGHRAETIEDLRNWALWHSIWSVIV